MTLGTTDDALYMAAQGVRVFPVRVSQNPDKPGKWDKTPMTPHGHKDASTDEVTIRAWDAEHPGCAWGAVAEKFVAMDIDGEEAWQEALRQGLLVTPELATMREGGRHLYYQPFEGAGCGAGIRPGIDIRGGGKGWVVLYGRWKLSEMNVTPEWFRRRPGNGHATGPAGQIPHGEHHDWLVRTAASFAAHTPGITVEGLIDKVRTEAGGVIDDLIVHDREILDACTSALDKYGKHSPSSPQVAAEGTDGPTLYAEVKTTLRTYLHWPADWCYDLGTLWVMQARIADRLPSVFYLFFSSSKGRGKTTALDLLAALTRGLNASNISVAALVHWLEEHPCGAVLVDEYDVARDAERDSALASIARDGYTPGKPYLRWDPIHREMDECPTYGAKAFGFRGSVDDALEDRGFAMPLPTVALRGREGAKLVARNMSRSVDDLPVRLRAWGARVGKEWSSPDCEDEEWLGKVEAVVGESYGANRETQLSMVVLSVADAVGVDVSDALRAALGLRREVASANIDLGIEEGREVIEEIIARTGTLTKEAEFYVVRQKDFAAAINSRRKERRERPLTSSQVAKLRNDLGIEVAWLTHPKNCVTWNLPAKEWMLSRGEANPPNPPNPQVKDDRVSQVSQVRHPPPDVPHDPVVNVTGGVANPPNPPNLHGVNGWVSQVSQVSQGAPERDPEDLLGPGPTMADRALANARREGSLAPDPPSRRRWRSGTGDMPRLSMRPGRGIRPPRLNPPLARSQTGRGWLVLGGVCRLETPQKRPAIPRSVFSPPFPVVSASPKEPQTTTAVDVVSVVSVVSLRPKEECVTPACRDCANCRTTEHKAADCLCASCTPWGGDFKLHWCGPPRTPVARANPFFYPPGGYRSGEAPTERYCVEGIEGVTIQGGEVFYDPPEEPSQAKEPRHE